MENISAQKKVIGVLHMHSTYSYDGKVELAELKKLLVAEGISFACMSEHTDELTPENAAQFVAECRDLSDEQFVFIPGFEVPYRDAHILMFGCSEFFGQIGDAAQLRAWREAAQLVILAHPVRNKFLLDEVMREVIDGVEIWNQQYDGKRVPRPRAYKLLQELRVERSGLVATGGLDLHRPEHLTYPRIALEGVKLREGEIIEALKAGRFSFGRESLRVRAKGDWPHSGSTTVRFTSMVSTGGIVFGKKVNGALASLGLRLPKHLTAFIRARV